MGDLTNEQKQLLRKWNKENNIITFNELSTEQQEKAFGKYIDNKFILEICYFLADLEIEKMVWKK